MANRTHLKMSWLDKRCAGETLAPQKQRGLGVQWLSGLQRCSRSGAVALLVLLLAMCAMSVGASVALLDEKRNGAQTEWRMTFTPRVVNEQAIREHVPMDVIPEAVGATSPRPEAQDVDSRRTSALIATGAAADFNASEWQVLFDDPSAAKNVAVDLSPVAVGVTHGVRVSFSPKKDWKTSATISLIHTARAGRKVSTLGVPSDAVGLQIGRNAFLNGAALVGGSRATNHGRVMLTLPQPIAPQKLVFNESTKGSVLSFSSNAFATTRLFHHCVEIARGALPGDVIWAYVPKAPPSIAAKDAICVDGASATPSPAITSRPAFSTLTAAGAEVEQWRTRWYEQNALYDRAVTLPFGERITAYRLVGTSSSFPSRSTQLQIDDVVTSDVLYARARLFGITDVIGFSPDHFAKIGMQGYSEEYTGVWQDAEETFAGGYFYSPAKRSVRSPGPVAGRQVTVVHRIFAGGSISIDGQGLDSIQLGWYGKPRLNSAGRLLLQVEETAEPRRVTIGGFPTGTTAADVLLLDVTDEAHPVILDSPNVFNDETGTVAIEFEAPADASTFYAERIATIQSATLETARTFAAENIDFLKGIYVRHDDLGAALQPLLAHRGAGYYTFDPQAAYDVFSHGQESPDAIREAFAEIVAAFAPGDRAAFPSLILVGTATFDRHNYLGLNRAYEVPTFIENSVPAAFGSAIRIETNVDAPYALLVGNDDLPDAMVGRLPARSAAEVTMMVDRIIAHDNRENFLGQQNRPAVFTTDYDPATVTPDANLWPGLWAPTGLPSVVVNAMDYVTTNTVTNLPEFNPSAMNAAVHDAFELAPLGPSLFFYFGHGNYNVWGPSGGTYFTSSDIATITTDQQWPMVLTFTCFNGYYAVPGASDRALGEHWLLQPLNRGAVANVASAGIDYYDSEKLFSIEAIELLGLPGSSRPKSVGELIARTRIAFTTEYPDQVETRHIHLLFGDPESDLTTTAGGSGFLFQ
ncbi:hypothetical protein IT571_05095 [Candidatus Sumerlaeota bacterium]|nr:hypothetical protein [Candidatus Sumerlaeota bacterium]